ncbi:MAG: hypothetical protein KGL95_15665 [Patescibacteria group bacterium]|nr:hypothetical protein [Patescibacteria group bacterium]
MNSIILSFTVVFLSFFGRTDMKILLPNSLQKNQIKDTVITVYQDGSFVVPAGEIWRIERVLAYDGGKYNIECCINLKGKVFKSGERVDAPVYSPEAFLLNDDMCTIRYIFEVEETIKDTDIK